MIRYLAFLVVALLIASGARAQAFINMQSAQERTIKGVYKRHRITPLEYKKLMREQDIIKETIARYQADGVLTAHEKNVIHQKLIRSEKRLRRYRMNGEVY